MSCAFSRCGSVGMNGSHGIANNREILWINTRPGPLAISARANAKNRQLAPNTADCRPSSGDLPGANGNRDFRRVKGAPVGGFVDDKEFINRPSRQKTGTIGAICCQIATNSSNQSTQWANGLNVQGQPKSPSLAPHYIYSLRIGARCRKIQSRGRGCPFPGVENFPSDADRSNKNSPQY
jgi:hypothetical protein